MKIEWVFFALFSVLTIASLFLCIIFNGNIGVALIGIISGALAVHAALKAI